MRLTRAALLAIVLLACAALPACTTQSTLPTTHTVNPGDGLPGLAEQYYGNALHWRYIYEANRDKLTSPNRVPAGIVLTIPELPDDAGDGLP